MKKIKCLIILCSVCLLVGCGSDNKVALTPSEFKSKITNAEYQLSNHSASFDYADAAYKIDTDEFYLFYLNGKKQYDVEGLFLDECENVYKQAGSDYKKKTRGGDDWLVLEITSEKKYYYLSMIKDTYIVANANLDRKGVIKDLVEDLGY